MLVAPLVAALVLAHTSPAWRSVSVTRSADGVRATLRYEVRGPATYPLLRGVHLSVSRHGRTTVDATLHGFAWGTLSLQLQDVWGDAEPEALVTNAECGNR